MQVPWRQAVGELDYLGGLLFTVAVTLILTGIVYTTVVPTSSPQVIGTLGSSLPLDFLPSRMGNFAKLAC